MLAQASGSLLPAVKFPQTLVAVGQMTLFGYEVVRSYCADGKSFVQSVVNPQDPHASLETRFYTLQQEAHPANAEEWDFLLSDEDGYVGYPFFDLGDYEAGGTRYPRLWSPGEGRIAPVIAEEVITAADGSTQILRHRLMLHGRRLGDGADASAPAEYLIADIIESEDGASFSVFLGLDVDGSALTVLSPVA